MNTKTIKSKLDKIAIETDIFASGEVEKFLSEYDIKDEEEYMHIAYILECIVDSLKNSNHLDHGHFVTAVKNRDWDRAYDYADGTNKKYFHLYLDFMKEFGF